MAGWKVKVLNVVATGFLNHPLDLRVVREKVKGVYGTPKFPSVTLKMRNPKATVSIFESGKIICAGGRSLSEAFTALRRIHKILVDAGAAPPNSKLKLEVRNIVASATLPGAFIDVEKASRELPGAVYVPEQFPAARYKPQGVNVSFLLYSSGKIICAGAKSVEELVEAVDVLHEQLEEQGLLIHP